MNNLFKLENSVARIARLFGIIALVAIIGFGFVACKMGDDGGNTETEKAKWPDELVGTWKNGDLTVKIEIAPNGIGRPPSYFIFNTSDLIMQLSKVEGDVFTCQGIDVICKFTMTVTDGKLTITSIINQDGAVPDDWDGYVNKTYTNG